MYHDTQSQPVRDKLDLLAYSDRYKSDLTTGDKTMTIPGTFEQGYDYTEFDGMPPEWWQGVRRRNGPIAQKVGPIAQKIVSALFPDVSLHEHIARVARSRQEGHTTLLTTSGHVIQFVPPQRAEDGKQKSPGAVYGSKEIDAKGVALVMEHYAKKGFNFTPATIPFGKSWSEADKKRIRTLWADVQEQQQPEAKPAIAVGQAPAAKRAPAYA